MNALVLGATGRIGNAVVRELLAGGARVTATSRRAAPPENLVGLPVDYRSGDADRPGTVEAWVRGHDVVVDAAAPYALRLRGERPLAAAERRLDELLRSVEREPAALVFVSSFVAEPRERPLLGRAQARLLRALHPYFALKRRMEARVTAALRAGLRGVVLRPTFCIGPWDISDPHVSFVPMLVNGELPALSHHALNAIDVRDVAALAAAALARGAFGRCISAVGHDTTVEMLGDLVCRAAGVPTPVWRVPAALGAAAAYANEVAHGCGASDSDLPAAGTLLLLEQGWAQRSRAQLDLCPELRPLSRTVADSLDWYELRGVLRRRP